MLEKPRYGELFEERVMWGLLRLGSVLSSKCISLIIFPLGPTPLNLIVIIMTVMMVMMICLLHPPSSYSSPDGAPFTGEGLRCIPSSQSVSYQAVVAPRPLDSWFQARSVLRGLSPSL